MNCDDSFLDHDEADFQRWYVGGSPPEVDGWSGRSFEEAMNGSPLAGDALHVDRLRAVTPAILSLERGHGIQPQFATA